MPARNRPSADSGMKHGCGLVFLWLRDLIPGRARSIRRALAEGPHVVASDNGVTLLEWFLPEARLVVWVQGPVPTGSTWAYADKLGRCESGDIMVPGTGEQE